MDSFSQTLGVDMQSRVITDKETLPMQSRGA
jgi:hypothetical protein